MLKQDNIYMDQIYKTNICIVFNEKFCEQIEHQI